MAILTERKVWARPRPVNAARRSSDLTPAEQANVKTALRFLWKRYGTLHKLADAMGAKPGTVKLAMGRRGGVSAGIALRVARVAGVHVESLLVGSWPAVGACPYCGHGSKVVAIYDGHGKS
jgi:hypothetical protein